ncbi:MAG: sodium:proton antiporter, partial [Alphaproteobacteria bacterium]|nr:sodium:proton antiporter [Alphaproteobacteria bacterium]
TSLFIPSLVCLIVSLFFMGLALKGDLAPPQKPDIEPVEPMGMTIFWLGIGCLVFVPIFKMLTGLPPFMGIIFGLGFMWLFTDVVHRHYENRSYLRVPQIMTNIDVSSVLFFLGILLSIDALHTAGLLDDAAKWMDRVIGNRDLIAIAIGLASAVVDNVPLVAAVMGMYDLAQYPTDSVFWNMIAYCAGTGGSILLIGSAAGVAFMGLEKVEFFWYFRRVGISAALGYFAGIGVYKLICAC